MDRFDERTVRLERRLADEGADGALVSSGPNAHYFTGFAGERDRHLLLLVTPDGRRTFISPADYAGQIRDNARVGSVRSVSDNTAEAVVDGLVETLETMETMETVEGTCLLDDTMAASEALRIERALPDANVGLLDEVVAPLRARKDEGERDTLRRAARLSDEVSTEIRELGADAIGMTEQELAVEIRTRLHERGTDGVAFPVVVAAGPNGARPTQYRHGDRQIRSGEPVVLDFGGIFDHYASDQTRTVVFDGDPPEGFVDAHAVVLDALEAGLDAVEPGMTGDDLDGLVRDVVAERGYGEQFVTGTGHGVGLRAHEPPSISPGSDDELQPGMVFSIEPGVYVEGEFGIRLETVVLLTEDGGEALNTSPYSWEPL